MLSLESPFVRLTCEKNASQIMVKMENKVIGRGTREIFFQSNDSNKIEDIILQLTSYCPNLTTINCSRNAELPDPDGCSDMETHYVQEYRSSNPLVKLQLINLQKFAEICQHTIFKYDI
ncbi:unnamed protein product [Rhizopus stolonifer]